MIEEWNQPFEGGEKLQDFQVWQRFEALNGELNPTEPQRGNEGGR